MLNFLEQILEKKPFNFNLTRSSQRDFTAKKLKKEEYIPCLKASYFNSLSALASSHLFSFFMDAFTR